MNLKRIVSGAKEKFRNKLEMEVLGEFKKFELDDLLEESEERYYYVREFDFYFWYIESERISLKSLFSNAGGSYLFRKWLELASKVEDEEKRDRFVLIFTKAYLGFFVLCDLDLVEEFGGLGKEDNYLKFWVSELEEEFVILKIEGFFKKDEKGMKKWQ